MTNYQQAFKQAQYQGVSDKAAKYYQETAKSYQIPVVESPVPDAYEYRHLDLLDPKASYSSLDYPEEGQAASTIHSYTDIQLFAQNMHLRFSRNDMNKYGMAILADKREAEIAKWALDVDDVMFHGPKNAQGVQLAEGLIGQLTSMQDLNGTDSNLATKGYIWKAIIKMINGIPFAMREEGPSMLLWVSSNLWLKLISPDRVYMGTQELDLIMRNLVNENARAGFKIGAIIVTDKILGLVGDAVADADGGQNITTADTQGTHDRMFLMVPDKRWVGRIISRGFSMLGEDRTINGGIKQNWAWRGRGYFFNTACAEFTEILAWA